MMQASQFPRAFDRITELGDQPVNFLLAYGSTPALDIEDDVNLRITGKLSKKQQKAVDAFVSKWATTKRLGRSITYAFIPDERDGEYCFRLSFWTRKEDRKIDWETWDKMDSIVRDMYRSIIEAACELENLINGDCTKGPVSVDYSMIW
jgi:hypothetical protein